jgi:thiol-disulfide isomerase/thioredoxin
MVSTSVTITRVWWLACLLLFPLFGKAETIDFSLPDLKGVERKLSEFRGKWVVLNYWATWCPPCLKEIPELVEFHEQHHDKNAVVVGVDFEDIPLNELVEFTESYFMNYPILTTKPTANTPVGVISGLPTTFLISPEGKLVARQSGPVTAQMIKDFINQQPTP